MAPKIAYAAREEWRPELLAELVDDRWMSADGPLVFELPRARPEIVFRFRRDEEAHAPWCDTVSIDTERGRLSMLFRARTRVQGRLEKLLFMGVRCHDR